MSATVEELKATIIYLKIELAKSKVEQGSCPCAYYKVNKDYNNCKNVDCKKCENDFWNEYSEKIAKTVMEL